MLVVELEKTKADNVKLYGKIRYVQDYNLEKVVSRGSRKVLFFRYCIIITPFVCVEVMIVVLCLLKFLSHASQNSEDLESGFSSDVESKYKKIYEDDINPFAAFSKKVSIFLCCIVFHLANLQTRKLHYLV